MSYESGIETANACIIGPVFMYIMSLLPLKCMFFTSTFFT